MSCLQWLRYFVKNVDSLWGAAQMLKSTAQIIFAAWNLITVEVTAVLDLWEKSCSWRSSSCMDSRNHSLLEWPSLWWSSNGLLLWILSVGMKGLLSFNYSTSAPSRHPLVSLLFCCLNKSDTRNQFAKRHGKSSIAMTLAGHASHSLRWFSSLLQPCFSTIF